MGNDMDNDDLERRLAEYRPVVERAMARRPLPRPGTGGRRSRWMVSVAAAGTVAAGVVGWVALQTSDDPASTGAGGWPGVTESTADDTWFEVLPGYGGPRACEGPMELDVAGSDAANEPTSTADGPNETLPREEAMLAEVCAAMKARILRACMSSGGDVVSDATVTIDSTLTFAVMPCWVDGYVDPTSWCAEMGGHTIPPDSAPSDSGNAGADPPVGSAPASGPPWYRVDAQCGTNGGGVFPLPPLTVAFGDFVMLGARDALDDYGITVNAAVDRQFDDLLDVLPLIVEQTSPDSVVIALGYNGAIDHTDLTAAMDLLADTPNVVVLTIALDRPWVAGNNELITALPDKYQNVTVLDWAELAPQCEGQCFASDGFHLSADGADYFADLIAAALGMS